MGRVKELWQSLVDRRIMILITAGYDPEEAEEIARDTSWPELNTELLRFINESSPNRKANP